ncbi:hypothetical protein ACPOL_5400 [Acidisarcina polymorpha]|uniref:Uncharacterized protein n=1 Tax=Acidisarcina polymorpha TaxID=2211140 RepID=A0A2Z5G6C5_9BACT|nr:hypothetical protein ACPOL_5400 [Acidisarcina polymorpha]
MEPKFLVRWLENLKAAARNERLTRRGLFTAWPDWAVEGHA